MWDTGHPPAHSAGTGGPGLGQGWASSLSWRPQDPVAPPPLQKHHPSHTASEGGGTRVHACPWHSLSHCSCWDSKVPVSPTAQCWGSVIDGRAHDSELAEGRPGWLCDSVERKRQEAEAPHALPAVGAEREGDETYGRESLMAFG